MPIFLFLLILVAFAGENRVCSETRLSVTYKTKTIPDEFLVQFQNKYWSKSRKKFLKAALLKENFYKWNVISRNNAASKYPSDFDVLQINDAAFIKNLSKIKTHPAIKNIVPHRSVLRLLSFESETNLTTITRQPKGLLKKGENGIPHQITTHLQANVLWKLGITGNGVKVAIFDTGLTKNHPHFRKVKERTNWTNEKSLDDGVSHGTFVAGIIASSKECLGFAPDAELHIYRVFTNSQVSYTSWFLDAFNYAISRKINILNLSIGGPDFLDEPFVDKVLELSANKVIMVSAIGNDGPLYGTLNNPADQSDVIGVGGIGYDNKLSKFSSRGMTTWELPSGYGRMKPDIVTYGSRVEGSDVKSGCRSLSGTSVSSPVVAGALSLITSGVLHKLHLVNPASLKQVLIEGATKLTDYNMFEQGYGKLNIVRTMQLLLTYQPKITLSPPYLDFNSNYMWPYSSQPLYYEGMPIIVNVTILNGISVSAKLFEQPSWYPYADKHGRYLNVSTEYTSKIWPWSGWMAVYISVTEEGRNFEGFAKGHISITIENLSTVENQTIIENITFPINVKIMPTPPRHKRILWDQYHNLRYPPGYIPRDNLKLKSDPLDWRADHIHTNFRDMYNHLRNSGYYVDVLREPYTCVNASSYGTLLIVDPEEEFFDEEIQILEKFVYDMGLSVIIFADWYNTTVMKKIKFFDENTRQWWIPDTGGSNIPALNELLKPFGIVLSDTIAEGHFKFGDHPMYYASGTTITKFPNNKNDIVIEAYLNNQGALILENTNAQSKNKMNLPILGLFQTNQETRKFYNGMDMNNPYGNSAELNTNNEVWRDNSAQEGNPFFKKRVLLNYNDFTNITGYNAQNSQKINKHFGKIIKKSKEGRLVVYGDSNCLDSTHLEKACFWLLNSLLDYTMNLHKSSLLKSLNRHSALKKNINPLPSRMPNSNMHKYSKVLSGGNQVKRKLYKDCKQITPLAGININSTNLSTHFHNQIGRTTNEYSQDEILLNLLSIELQSVSTLGVDNDPDNINFYMRNSIIFSVTLTIFVIILFIKFVRRKRFDLSTRLV